MRERASATIPKKLTVFPVLYLINDDSDDDDDNDQKC